MNTVALGKGKGFVLTGVTGLVTLVLGKLGGDGLCWVESKAKVLVSQTLSQALNWVASQSTESIGRS